MKLSHKHFLLDSVSFSHCYKPHLHCVTRKLGNEGGTEYLSLWKADPVCIMSQLSFPLPPSEIYHYTCTCTIHRVPHYRIRPLFVEQGCIFFPCTNTDQGTTYIVYVGMCTKYSTLFKLQALRPICDGLHETKPCLPLLPLYLPGPETATAHIQLCFLPPRGCTW